LVDIIGHEGSLHLPSAEGQEIISYALWLYYRFPLNLRMVEEMLAARGIEFTYETVRCWATKFGQAIAKRNQFGGARSR
jgi:transposase-like protein